MLRSTGVALALLTIVTSVFAEEPKAVPKDLAPFQGKWQAVQVTFFGQAQPAENVKKQDIVLEIVGDKGVQTQDGKAKKPATIKVDGSQSPGHFDIITDQKASSLTGIYKLDKDTLTLCLAGESRPTNFEDAKTILVVYKKIK